MQLKRKLIVNVFLLPFCPCVFAAVFWEAKSQPAILGESLTLYCNTSSVKKGCEQCSKRWHKGESLELLVFDGNPMDKSKYESVEDSNGFGLVIKNLTEQDFNELYICSVGVYSATKRLQVDDNFQLHPTNDSINITHYIGSNSMLNLQVDFKKVQPPPKCTLFLNEENVSSKLIKNQQKEGLFYRVTFELQHDVKPYQCNGHMLLECIIGTQNATVVLKKIDYSCTDDSFSKQTMSAIVGLVFSVIFILCVIILWIATHMKCLNMKFMKKAASQAKIVLHRSMSNIPDDYSPLHVQEETPHSEAACSRNV